MAIPKVDRSLAWFTTQTVLMCIGGTSLIAAIATMHWILMSGAVVVISGLWIIIYKTASLFRDGKAVKNEAISPLV